MKTALRGLAALVCAGALCAAAGGGVHGELPLSADEEDRAPGLEDTSLPPGFSAVGMISACPGKECRPRCTAFLTGPDLAVTAAHCVKTAGGHWYDPARIRFHSSAHPAVRAAEYVHAGDYARPPRHHSGSLAEAMPLRGQDIAVLRLAGRPGGRLGWLPKGKVDWDEMAGGGEYEIAGLPGGKFFHMRACKIHPETARLWKARHGPLRTVFEKGVFFHTCHLRRGFSGGPLLRRENGGLTWIGVTSGTLRMEPVGHHSIDDAALAVILLPGGEPAPLRGPQP